MYLSTGRWLILRLALAGLVGFSSHSVFALHIGVIDELTVLSTPFAQTLIQSAAKKLEQSKAKADSFYKQLQKLSIELGKNEMIMDEKSRTQQKAKIYTLQKKWQEALNEAHQQEEVAKNQLQQKLIDSATKVAKQKNLDLVFSKESGIIYAGSAFDCTQAVIRALSDTKEKVVHATKENMSL